jgi:hypothetical protein
MSVKINGEEFKIYLQDTLDTIKERYCLEKETIPKLCYMNIIKQNNISIFESKKVGSTVLSILKENAYDTNPLEGAEIEGKTFSDFYLEAEIDEDDFDRSFNKFVIDALELFSFSSRDEVFFTYIIITNSDPINEADYSESYERAIEQYTELIDKKNEYASYFSFYKKELESLSLRVEKNISQSESVKAIVELVEEEQQENRNIVKSDLKLTEYSYNGDFKYSIDIYDFFSKFKTTKICPYIRLAKYHKVYNGVRIIDEEWFENYNEDDDTVLQMFILGKKQETDEILSLEKYYLVEIKQLSEDKGIFTFNMSINVNEQMDLTEDEIFERTISYFSLPLIDLGLKKQFGKGYFVMKGIEVSDELFFDTCLNDPKVNNIIFIDEKYKIQKERGGIRFYVSENNLETSIKCSLVKKIVLKSTDIEAVAFPDIIRVKDFITVISITKGTSMSETLKLIGLFENLLMYIETRKKFFLEYYEKFMTKLEDIDSKLIKKKSKEKKDLTLKDLYPQIFISGYARFCQPVAPKLITQDEYEDDITAGIDAMIYPRDPEEGPQDYYSCKHDKKYKYVGIKENSLSNKDQIKFLPCCFEKDQKIGDKLRYKYENYKEDEDESGFKLLIKSKKILQEKQYGYLPQNISYTFTIVNEDCLTGKSRFLRTGIKRGENSSLYAIKKALNLDTDIKSMRKDILKVIKNNFASQYGLKPKEIKNIIEQNLNIDPELFLEIFENVFKVNIILFCRDRLSNKEGSMCKPKFKKFFILNPNKRLYDKTIMLYKTDGGEFDNLQYPHTELIVLENNIKSDDNVGENTSVFFKDSFISKLYAMYYSFVETKYIKSDLKNKIIGQIDDGNGKIRLLQVNYKNENINILTSPCSNFQLNQFLENEKAIYTNKISLINPSLIIDFFTDEGIKDIRKILVSNTVVGLYGKKGDLEMYIPCDMRTSEFSKLPGSTNIKEYDNKKELPAPSSLTFSILNQYNTFLKTSNSIISYSLFLFSNFFQYEMKNLFLTKDENEFIDKIKAVLVVFENKHLTVDLNKKYENLTRELTLENNDILTDKHIVIPSTEIKKKILYCLYIQMKHNLSLLIDYKYKKYVDNFYTSSKDFKVSEGEQNIFYTMKEIRLYMIPIINPYKVYYEIPGGINDEISFYYKNINIDEDTVFRAIKTNSIEQALSYSKQWAKNKRVYLYTESIIDPDSVSFILYEMEDEYSVKTHDFIGKKQDEIFRVLLANIENEIKIYALLPV